MGQSCEGNWYVVSVLTHVATYEVSLTVGPVLCTCTLCTGGVSTGWGNTMYLPHPSASVFLQSLMKVSGAYVEVYIVIILHVHVCQGLCSTHLHVQAITWSHTDIPTD